MVLSMLLGYSELFYALFSKIIYDLMLVLKLMFEQVFFTIKIAYKFIAFINFHSFRKKMANTYVNQVNFEDIQHLLKECIICHYLHHSYL